MDERLFTIDVNGQLKLAVEGGKALLNTLGDNGIFVSTVCGGRGICGQCKVKVVEGGGALQDAEKRLLDENEQKEGVRLSCQVQVQSDLKVQVPEELLKVQEYACELIEIEELTYDTRRFRFEFKEPDSMDFVPGQYVQLVTPRYTKNSEEVIRAYSIASDPGEQNFIDLIIRRVPDGICTTWCFDHLKVGDTVKLTGPYGEFRLSDGDGPMIFIAGASGMSPFVSILHKMKREGSKRKAVYYFGGNTTKDMFLIERMQKFESELGDFKFVPVVARPEENAKWEGETGLVTEAVRRNFKELNGWEGYLCGSPGMIDASVKVLVELGISEDNIYYDKFA